MKQSIKKVGKKAVHGSLRVGKKALSGSPKLKRKLKNAITTHIHVPPVMVGDNYRVWQINNTPDGIDLLKQTAESKAFKYRPLISILVPTYNTPEKFFHEMVESVLAQSYDNWELVFVDDASPDPEVRMLIKEYAAKDSRIVHKFLKKNHHIAGATNEGIAMAKGEFVSLFDHDDILWPNALYEVVKLLNEHKDADLIYTDEDKIDGNNRRAHRDPFFKPAWSPELLRSINYITHFTTIRKSVLDEFGYEDGKYNGAQDWELFLRITRNVPAKNIYHIPRILYSWRVHEQSTAMGTDAKPYVIEAQRNALIDDAKARGVVVDVSQDPQTQYWRVQPKMTEQPLISIVIPTRNLYSVVKRCIESIYEKTTYPDFEIILVDTGSDDPKVHAWYETLRQKRDNIKIVEFIEEQFSFAKSSNYGAEQASGELLVMLNNDIEIESPNWLEYMASYAIQDGVGAVGVKLLYPGGKLVQHAGVGIGIGGCGSNLFVGISDDTALTLTQNTLLRTVRNSSAVTAACLMVKADVFNEMHGFAEKYRINYNDVDLCLRIREAGYRNVFLPDVRILHHESISRGLPGDKSHESQEFVDAQAMFMKDWQAYIDADPFYNQNFTRTTTTADVSTDIKV